MQKFSAEPQTAPEPDNGEASPPSLRLARADKRRKQVLDAARTVFCRHGFHGASMAQVASEAGMSVGHIYRYFENKEAVIVAIVEQDMQLAKETIGRMLQDPAGLPAAMVAGVDEGVAKMLDRQDSALFMEVMSEAARNSRVAESARLQHQAAYDCVGLLFKDRDGDEGPFTREQKVDLLNLIFSGLRIRSIQDPDADATVLATTIRALVMLLTK